jgi:quinolinate synthase
MDQRIRAAREILGRDVVILGHHYQRDEIIRFADFRGDSYKLSKEAAKAGGKYIVFCGVHFMAESADVLSARPDHHPPRPQCRMLHGRHGGDHAG